MPAFDVSISTTINKPITEVFTKMIDPDFLPEWFTIIDGIRDYNGEDAQVGLEYKTVGHFMGREIISDCVVTAYDPPHKIIFKTESGALLTTNTWTYDSMGNMTLVNIKLEGETKGFIGRVAGPLLGGQLEKDITRDLQSFKGLMESR